MTFHTNAIYEGGVLRPLTPVELKEREVVSLAISTMTPHEVPQTESARQRRVLLEYVSKIESRPDDTPRDGLTNRDHDRLIYGK